MLKGLVVSILYLKLGSYQKKLAPNILFLSKTKVNTNRTMDTLPKLEFDCQDFINPIRFSRGLWLHWIPNVSSLDIILKNDRMFHCMAYFSNLNINYFFTFLQGYPQHFKQKEIQDILLNIKNYIIPWVIVGDFNEILCPYKKNQENQWQLLQNEKFYKIY